MDLDIGKIVAKFNKDQIIEYKQNTKEIFKEIEKYICKNGGIIGGIMALKNIADEANVTFDTEKNGYYLFANKPHIYIINIAKHLSEKKNYSNLTVSSNFKGEFELSFSDNVILTIKNIGEKNLKVMPSRKSTLNKLTYVAPIMLKIEYLLNFIDVQEGVEHWLDFYKRDELLEFIMPFKLTGKEPPKGSGKHNKGTSDVLSKIKQWGIKDNKIFIGTYAYLLFVDSFKDVFRPTIMFYEMFSKNPKNDIESLKELLGKNNITVKSNYSDLGYHGEKWSINYKNAKILDLYDSSNFCIPFVEIIKDNQLITIGNYYVVLLYLNLGVLTSYQIETVNKLAAERLRDRLNMMMIDLIISRKNYLLKIKQTGIAGDSLFDVFQSNCSGQQKNYRREWNIRKWNGKIKRFFQEF